MQYFFAFLITLGAWLVVLLALDTQADPLKIFVVAVASAIVSLTIWKSSFKPLMRWYMKNFSKSYKYRRQRPILKEKIKEEEKV